jgi:hypothetical protein
VAKELLEAPNLPDKFIMPTTLKDGGAHDMGKSSSLYSRGPCSLSLYFLLPSHGNLLLAYKREGTEGNKGIPSFCLHFNGALS